MMVAKIAAEAAGQILREMLETAEVREKGPKDLVTDADLAAQREIEKQILSAFPSHRFVGEESSQPQDWEKVADHELLWVVDPLDGTANYVHRLPNFAVSIALMQGNRTLIGVVYDPMAREMFSALLGRGATRNDRSIQSSDCQSLEQAMVAASFPPQVHRESVEIKQFIEILLRSQSIRRLGSAALNLCYVATGRLDAYWANELKPWDLAAGLLIAQEAGAIACRLNGDDASPWFGDVLASATRPLSCEMRECLAGAVATRISD
ncbi:MAG: inositol monophosphatase family protein [Pirellula sp.]